MTDTIHAIEPRMKNAAALLPGSVEAVQALIACCRQGGVPETTLELVHLRASQVNGCSFCVDSGSKHAKQGGETDERLFAVAAWRESPYFTDAERAALELTEQGTRIADAAGGVTDEAWANAVKHYDEEQLAALVSQIALINAFNRGNVIIQQPAGDYQPGQFG
jgi:AhpD family alkylhydroperoxidase